MRQWSLAIHGGAGLIRQDGLTPEQDAAYRASLTRIAADAAAMLAAGARALDAVETAVRALEDDPLFNAGRGAVFTALGENRLDASIMDGRDLNAGAVAGVTGIANPVSLARAVMEKSPHVMLSGTGARAFARHLGIPDAPPSYFFSPRRWRSLENFLKANDLPVPPRPDGVTDAPQQALVHDEGKHGTVGAVARDREGHVAAATSTGGTTGKQWGRVGDTPIIGAGCYADDRACAVSCTGTGEHFIRLSLAHAMAARVALKGESVEASGRAMIGDLTRLGGEGGVIAVAQDGAITWRFNTAGMYRARAASDEPLKIALYGDEG